MLFGNVAARVRFSFVVVFGVLVGASVVEAQQSEGPPMKVSAAQFQRLKFLEGKWRGTGYRVPFFETYRFVNDSTIEMGTSEDSTFRKVEKGSTLVLRNGSIYSQDNGQSRWAVTRIDSAGYRFSAIGRPGLFVWKSITPNEWSAVLQNGTVYRMHRIR
jgi:hypothetical protein